MVLSLGLKSYRGRCSLLPGWSLPQHGYNRAWGWPLPPLTGVQSDQEGLDACYNNAYSNNLWGSGYIGSYSMTNWQEYFANGLMTYFDVQYPYDEEAPRTRTELYQKDPQFATFIDTWMYSKSWRGCCPKFKCLSIFCSMWTNTNIFLPTTWSGYI